MPAHEPPAERSPREIDIDGDVDVFRDGPDPAEVTGASFDPDSPAPPFHTPIPGEHLSEAQLERDLEDPDAPAE